MYSLDLDKLTQVALPKLIAGSPAALEPFFFFFTGNEGETHKCLQN